WEATTEANPGTSLQRAPRQRALLELLRSKQRLRVEEIVAAGFDASLLRELKKKGLVQQGQAREQPGSKFAPVPERRHWPLQLNPEQQAALERMAALGPTPPPVLLDGVTGSGKTEVYMRLIHQQLSLGRQCLVLVPEIGLTPQTIDRFRNNFDCLVAVLHSGLSDRERLLAWQQAREGQAGIIIGTRSAIFTPLASPGLIVIDEEHDSSFKQQDGFRYSARDLAAFRARAESIPLVLGSATPSLESLHNCRSGKFVRIQLLERAGNSSPAAMLLVDVANQVLSEGISESVQEDMQRHLHNGNQEQVFSNRRGFPPVLSCQVCTWQSECENCVAQMTVHRSPPQLRCHHCDALRPIPEFCPVCKAAELTTFGLGTQKVQQFLEQRFPGVPLFRVDRDTTRGKDSFLRLAEQLKNTRPAILLGTQMLAKGHHFPAITQVVVIDADHGLFSADFRGQEQMSQTLIQVAGRAGRAEHLGEVMVQTRHASHPSLKKLVEEGYPAFADYLLTERRASTMPPYAYLAVFRAEAQAMKQALGFLGKVKQLSQQICGARPYEIDLHGPLPAPMERRAGRYRAQLQCKSESRAQLQDFLQSLVATVEAINPTRSLRWSVDVDPIDLI
ncbi:MAG: primosomal protein N', partial [Gammaproteobacteria bacterium]